MVRKFEWDENKNRININKHGISFQTACRVVLDPDSIELNDLHHSTAKESRYIIIGEVNRVIFVVYTERADATRIISARIATKSEERFYYDNKLRN